MRIVFVIGQAALGGIETYCLRMATALVVAGVDVEIWVVKRQFDRNLLDALREVAPVHWLTPRWMPYPLTLAARSFPPDTSLVFTTGRLSLIHAAACAQRSERPIKLVAGVFSQWEYVQKGPSAKGALANEILRQIGYENMIFCTAGCRAEHASVLGEVYRQSLVSPLLVKLPTATDHSKRSMRYPISILTIANLTPFKTVCTQIPDIVKALKMRDIDVRWAIVGDGEMRETIISAIQNADVAREVTLEGPIPYEQMAARLAKSDLYVGSGTTLIEASAYGVPAIVGLDDNPDPTTPGYFCDRDGHYTSDVNPDEVLRLIVDVIEKFSKMNEDARASLQQRSIERAQAYDVRNAKSEIARISHVAKDRSVSVAAKTRWAFTISSMIEAVRYVVTGKYDNVR